MTGGNTSDCRKMRRRYKRRNEVLIEVERRD
jgi:hypothetical protein